jgi:hypothetical protein
VEEMTSRLPVTESPPWRRITAVVYSVGRIRGARQADDADCLVICLIISIHELVIAMGGRSDEELDKQYKLQMAFPIAASRSHLKTISERMRILASKLP